jgi:hypothetical protein
MGSNEVMSFVFSSEVSCLKERNPLDTNEVVEIVSGFHKDQLRPRTAITAEPHTHTHSGIEQF